MKVWVQDAIKHLTALVAGMDVLLGLPIPELANVLAELARLHAERAASARGSTAALAARSRKVFIHITTVTTICPDMYARHALIIGPAWL